MAQCQICQRRFRGVAHKPKRHCLRCWRIQRRGPLFTQLMADLEIIIALGATVKSVAKAIDARPEGVSRWRHGTGDPTREQLLRLHNFVQERFTTRRAP